MLFYENIDKNAKKFMHWNVPPDVLPGSERLVCVLDRWLNDYKQGIIRSCTTSKFIMPSCLYVASLQAKPYVDTLGS